MSTNPILKISKVSRTFGAIQALKEANFEINEGEIMGLVGENGAGKSTLVKIISGFDPGFKGSYQINGKEVKFETPSQAEESGIAIAQQELSLIPNMSVAENIFLTGAKVKKFATLNTLANMARPYLDEVGLTEVDPTTRINLLSVGEQHLVEVARLISREAKILILDEPTAALGEAESRRILEMVERLAANGKSIIYVSHRLDEIFKITKRITILRDGVSQGIQETKDIDVNKLVEIMLGRALGAENIKFFGQVLPTSKKVLYKINIKRIINRDAIVGLADGEMYVDDRKIYTAEKLKVGLFRDPSKF